MPNCSICNNTGQYKGINRLGKETILFCDCPDLPMGEKWGWRSRGGCLGNTYELLSDTPDSSMPPVNFIRPKGVSTARKVIEAEKPKEKVIGINL